MLTHTCWKCHTSFKDDVCKDEYTRGSKAQEVEVDDIPWLCNSCNNKLK